MTDIKTDLHDQLKWIRDALVWKIDGLSEYDIRRPLTVTGTNLLGLVKHSATWESRYFGFVFGRPFPEPLPEWNDKAARGTDLWVRADETRQEIVSLYRRVGEHADATITELPLDAHGRVPWWPHPEVKLFNILVHLLTETYRHAGHADILREQLDGHTGVGPGHGGAIDAARVEARRTMIEAAAAPFN